MACSSSIAGEVEAPSKRGFPAFRQSLRPIVVEHEVHLESLHAVSMRLRKRMNSSAVARLALADTVRK